MGGIVGGNLIIEAGKRKRVRSFLIQPFVLAPYSGAPGAIRTPDPLVRSQVLYPAELRAHCVFEAAHYIESCGPLQAIFEVFIVASVAPHGALVACVKPRRIEGAATAAFMETAS